MRNLVGLSEGSQRGRLSSLIVVRCIAGERVVDTGACLVPPANVTFQWGVSWRQGSDVLKRSFTICWRDIERKVVLRRGDVVGDWCSNLVRRILAGFVLEDELEVDGLSGGRPSCVDELSPGPPLQDESERHLSTHFLKSVATMGVMHSWLWVSAFLQSLQQKP